MLFRSLIADTLAADSKAAGRWSTSRGGEYFAIGAEGAVHYGGLSLLAAPDGQTIAQADRSATVLVATLHDTRLTAARAHAHHVRDVAIRSPHSV